MTRDTVKVSDTTVADVFHDHESDDPHITITLGGDTQFEFTGAAGEDYVDVEIDGHETDIDDLDWGEDRHRKQRTFVVRQNGEEVASGVQETVAPAPVLLTVGGFNKIALPGNQRIEIDVHGDPA